MDEMHFQLCGRDWTVCRGDMEKLWAEMDAFDDPNDERLPYWAELWPSSLALAEWLTGHSDALKGKKCLDLGCGLGFTAIAGAAAGAEVTGADYEESALVLARRNAELNGLGKESRLSFRKLDWRSPDIAPESFDIIWGADIVYEKQAARQVLDFLIYALKPDGIAWLAEPGRSIFDAFLDIIGSSPLQETKLTAIRTAALSANIPSANVNIREIRRRS